MSFRYAFTQEHSLSSLNFTSFPYAVTKGKGTHTTQEATNLQPVRNLHFERQDLERATVNGKEQKLISVLPNKFSN